MRILGIESSCDDTSVALIEKIDTDINILAEKTASQIDVHKKYGGVVPEIAGRMHAENIIPLVEAVMDGQEKPEVIAVTNGPGLITGLLVGVEAAKALSYLWDVPLIGVNHIEGHIHSVQVKREVQPNNEITFPAVCLIVSGGHTELVLMKDHGEYELIGKTRDDAVGEAFDKVGKLVGLAYPGGPKIAKCAEGGNPHAIDFPRPMIDADNVDFSFAGLKTAALYWLRDHAKKQDTGYRFRDSGINDFCASFEQAAVDVLAAKTKKALHAYAPKTLILAGGVSANKKLRETLKTMADNTHFNLEFRTAHLKYCMDNAAMIAVAGAFHAEKNQYTPWKDIAVDPNAKIY